MTASERTDMTIPTIPRLVPEPLRCSGIKEPVICLDGTWEVLDERDNSIRQVQVPFDMVVYRKKTGLSRHYEYRREILLPKEAEGSRVVLRFEGVNGFARVWIDDVETASHKNGFLTWNVEITEQVKGKDKVMLRVGVDEETDVVSAYSHGGILHSVYLYFLPENYVNAVYLSPLFDEDMETCTLRVDMDLAGGAEEAYGAAFRLYGPDHAMAAEKKLVLRKNCSGGALDGSFCVRREGYYTVNLPIAEPRLWDAEHPNMYTLEISLLKDGEELECLRKKTGLRLLERKGNRLFVNRQEIKLRGVCRHEISPRCGRALTRELIEKDVALFKEANCNYIRTSHYPPSEYFLEQCDENGIYVEDELALAFIARTLPYTQRDPEQTERYLSHFTECLARDYNHPGVIIWSLCNESFGGYNFDLLNRFVHKKDPTRMTKFSYPMTIREEHEMPDIWSIHYSEYDADLAKKRDNVSVGYAPGKDMPVLHDEYVHVCCYNREELRRDPAARSFWGEGIRIFWDNIWNTEGALGGAIWAGIDETDIYDGGSTQLEWGIIDVWRRKKPEFYMTRKAYSPIRVIHYERLHGEDRVLLVIENRFNHTNLSEVRVDWKCGEKEGACRLPYAKPGMTVKAFIPLDGAGKEPVCLSFMDAGGFRVDELVVCVENQRQELLSFVRGNAAPALKRKDNGDETVFEGDGFQFCFSNTTGLLKELTAGGKRLLTGGPYLNAPYLKLGSWYLKAFEVRETADGAELITSGGYEKSLELTWKMRISADGAFTVSYLIDRMEKYLPKQLKLRVGVDCGGLDELGVAFFADPSMDTLSWSRQINPDLEGDYTWYPADHISRNIGTANRYTKNNVWGEEPVTTWAGDMKNDILNGYYDVDYKGSNDFRATKERIEEACLYHDGDSVAVGVDGKDGDANVRIEVVDPKEWKITDRDARIRYSGTWYQVDDRKESDHGTETWSHEKGACAECTFQGTGIVWYGPQDTTYGKADIYVDGRLTAKGLSQRVAGVDFSCSSVGYDKKYHLPIFSVDGLKPGEHTLRIEVSGEKAEDASDCYIVIDYFRVLNGQRMEPVKLIVNQEFAFPHLSWGNYRKKPILMKEGTEGSVSLRVINQNKEKVGELIERGISRCPGF